MERECQDFDEMNTLIRCARCGHEYRQDEISERFEGLCPRCLANVAMSPAAVDAPPPEPLKRGATFHGLEIMGVLGHGGMGTVYSARQINLDRFVALKILSPALAVAPEFAERFHREAKVLAALDHPNIVRVIDFGREHDLYFLTMEYVDGVSLRGLMGTKALPTSDALALIPQICEALEYAHSRGVVHRDIKPENILIGPGGRVKIADFGLARMRRDDSERPTETNLVMGTPRYMAPEQHDDLRKADHRADIYSLGVIFYEMLTGQVPMGRFDPPSKRARVDERFDRIVLKALEQDPDRRYQRAREVKTDVQTVIATPSQRVPRLAPPLPWAVLVFAGAGLLALIFAGIFLVLGFKSKTETPPETAGRSQIPAKKDPPPRALSGDLFEKSHAAIEAAKTMRVRFRTEYQSAGSNHIREGTLLLGTGGKTHLSGGSGMKIICDGKRLVGKGPPMEAPPTLDERWRNGIATIGIMPALDDVAYRWAEPQMRIKDLRRGESVKLGDVNAVEYAYTTRIDGLPDSPIDYAVKLWIGERGLPLKREMTMTKSNLSFTIVEEYSEFEIDPAIPDDQFKIKD